MSHQDGMRLPESPACPLCGELERVGDWEGCFANGISHHWKCHTVQFTDGRPLMQGMACRVRERDQVIFKLRAEVDRLTADLKVVRKEATIATQNLADTERLTAENEELTEARDAIAGAFSELRDSQVMAYEFSFLLEREHLKAKNVELRQRAERAEAILRRIRGHYAGWHVEHPVHVLEKIGQELEAAKGK